MTRVHIAIKDLSCYITMEGHCLQTWAESERTGGDRAWPSPSWLIVLSLHPSFNVEKSEGLSFQLAHRGKPALLQSPPQGFCDPIFLLVSFPKTSCICWVLLLCVCVCGGEPKTTLRLEDSLLIEELPGLGEAVRHRVMAYFHARLWGKMGTGRRDTVQHLEKAREAAGVLSLWACVV